jgi:hypothetical protein
MKVEPISKKDGAMSRGYWAGIKIDSVTGRMRGGVSRDVEGEVVGY